jgi:hypothetical protein
VYGRQLTQQDRMFLTHDLELGRHPGTALAILTFGIKLLEKVHKNPASLPPYAQRHPQRDLLVEGMKLMVDAYVQRFTGLAMVMDNPERLN